MQKGINKVTRITIPQHDAKFLGWLLLLVEFERRANVLWVLTFSIATKSQLTEEKRVMEIDEKTKNLQHRLACQPSIDLIVTGVDFIPNSDKNFRRCESLDQVIDVLDSFVFVICKIIESSPARFERVCRGFRGS